MRYSLVETPVESVMIILEGVITPFVYLSYETIDF